SRRRAALDKSFATEHPIRPAKEGKDPTERLKATEPKRRKPAAPAPVNEKAPEPDVPETPAAMQRMAEVAAREGEALARMTGTRWLWEEAVPVEEIALWFEEHG